MNLVICLLSAKVLIFTTWMDGDWIEHLPEPESRIKQANT